MTNVRFRKTDLVPQSGQKQAQIVIAVDGPAASGKGTLAKKLAERLNFAHLDTGALYRAVGYAALELGGDLDNPEDIEAAVGLVKRNITPELLSNPELRTPEASDAASKVAARPDVRKALLEMQRDLAKNPPNGMGGVILDGRDIGTVVCPDADIKLFITATTEERAYRRHVELEAAGEKVTLAEVTTQIAERDERDATRDLAPMVAAEDAYTLDTTVLTANEVLNQAIAIIRTRFLDETAQES